MTTLTETSLTTLERATLDRFLDLLRTELGDDLVSVWLYGSRARGERPEPESDVDVLVLTRVDRGGATAARAIEASAISLAYYAMSYAARGALSERDLFARRHKGMWGLFHQHFVATGEFDRTVYAGAAAAQKSREEADYEARGVTEEEAQEALALAERFVAAVRELIGE